MDKSKVSFNGTLWKIIISLFAIVIMYICIPIITNIDFSNVSYGATYGDYEYEIKNDGTVEITKYNGNAQNVTIPSKINGNSVTSIGDFAFSGCHNLNSITIPSSVKSIEGWAFQFCDSLTSITIPNSVTSIGKAAFSQCSSLTSVTIPNGVESIGDEAFYSCENLILITIPSSVTSVGKNPFAFCRGLEKIIVDVNNKKYMSKNGVLFSKDGTHIIAYPCGKKEKQYEIPAGVTIIEDVAFNGCLNLISITIPSSVTSIGEMAFNRCDSLISITIPSSVTIIGDEAFEYCSSLTSITIPNSVTDIASYVFYGCSNLKNIYYKGSTYLNQWRKDNEDQIKSESNANVKFIRLNKPKISSIKKISNLGKSIKKNNVVYNYIKKDSELKLKLVFGEEINRSNIDTSKIKLSGANGSLIIDSISKNECNIIIKGGTSNGKISVSIEEGFLKDEFGNKSAKSTAIEKVNIIQDNQAPNAVASYDEENNKMKFEIKDSSKITKYQFKKLDENNKATWTGEEHKCSVDIIKREWKISKYQKIALYVEDILGNKKTYVINPYVKSSIKLVKREGNIVTYRIKTNVKCQIYSSKIQYIQVPNGCKVMSLINEDSTGKSFLLTVNTNGSSKSGNVSIPKGTIYAYDTNSSKETGVEIYMENYAPTINLGSIPTNKQKQIKLGFYIADSDSGIKKYSLERLDDNGEVQKVLRNKKVSTTEIVRHYNDSITIQKNGKIRLTVWDNQDNIKESFIDIQNIDRTAPKAQILYGTPNENGQLSITIVADEKVTIMKDENTLSTDWINISNDVKQKVYNESDLNGTGTKDNLLVVDEAGNKKSIKIKDKVAPKVVNIVKERETNGSINAIVQLNEQIKLTEDLLQTGWALSEDKCYLNKILTQNEEIVVTDLSGNNSEIIKVEVEEENGQIEKLYKRKKYEPAGSNTPTETVIKYLYLNRPIESVDLMNLNGRVECELLDENKTVKLTFKQNVKTKENIKFIENDNYVEKIGICKVTNIVIKGDSNDDGKVTNEDLGILKNVYLGKVEEDNERKIFAMDMDNNGVIDKKDYLALSQKLKNEGV